MPTRDAAPLGAPCWVDLLSSDLTTSREFYEQAFGWTAEEPQSEFGGYFTFTREGLPVGGAMAQQPGSQIPDTWSIYLATDDAAKRVAAAVEAGATVMVEPMQVGSLGVMAVIGDPTGATIGLWQPIEFSGFGVLAEPGTPSWFELQDRDHDKAVEFYRDVLGWETEVLSHTAGFSYTTLGSGAAAAAGIADATSWLPEGVPSHWVLYFGTEDTDAQLARIVELGGSVIDPATDTPYGRLATAVDPTGAVFKLMAPNEQMPARN